MPLPAQLYRPKKDVHKNTFGHVLILAGSRNMAGACALTSLAALRSGAGLVTIGIPASLNGIIQKKISNEIMTLPLKETKDQTISNSAWNQLKNEINRFDAIALGPGLTINPSTQNFILKIIGQSTQPLIIDADAINALAGKTDCLNFLDTPKILTPHPGEMARLLQCPKSQLENNRREAVKSFIRKYNSCTLLLKGHETLVAHAEKKIYTNTTGNAGMAKAGCGDVLTGIIASFVAQGLMPFEAAKYGCYVHGLAGDFASQRKSKTSMIAGDIIDELDNVFKK